MSPRYKLEAVPEDKSRLLSPIALKQMKAEAWAEANKRFNTLHNNAYFKFQDRYRDDRVAFVHDCIKWKNDRKPTFYQDEILGLFPEHKRVSIRGPHGLGKTTQAAWLILHYALTRDGDDWKIPTTASVWLQLTQYLWPEVHKWARMINWLKVGRDPFDSRNELLTLNLKLNTGQAYAGSPDKPESIEGAHADYLLYVFDESKSIAGELFDAAEGAFSGGGDDTAVEAFAFSISTPGEPFGRFYDIQSRKTGYEDWKVRHVRLDEAIAAGRVSREWAEQRKKQWGESSAIYQNRVLGEFAASDEDGVIPLSYVERAVQRWEEWNANGKPGTVDGIGVDVGLGGEGSDKTVAAIRKDRYKIDELKRKPRGNTETALMETAGEVAGFLRGNPEADAYIDVIGIGAGAVHRLKEQDDVASRVYGFNAAEAPPESAAYDQNKELRFKNKRSAMWWKMRELLMMDDCLVALPPDDKLLGDLTAPHYKILSGGIIQVESKDDIRKRIKRSTDDGDAVLQVLIGPELCIAPKTRVYVVGQGYVED